MDRTSLLQAIRLKGIAPITALAEALGIAASDVEGQLGPLESEGHLERSPRGLRLTETGRASLAGALAAERSAIDRGALEGVYQRFDTINTEFKQLVTDWQLREVDGQRTINDHGDPAYDRAILTRLLALHDRFEPVVQDSARCIPRLAAYSRRFESARTRISGGDSRYLAAPLIDSYHTVWFEFHEELLQAAGRSRAHEAAAGRAD